MCDITLKEAAAAKALRSNRVAFCSPQRSESTTRIFAQICRCSEGWRRLMVEFASDGPYLSGFIDVE